ncbi:glycosyltransferase family 4 protein [Agriterribacter sp.]|uniref:glycosyltransferase n=1 Tax=Agriterribacter sp. TaxID=2821509 RepID=UPI002BA2FE3E|nr:glycosyltransferase family 4 protein [Agriterribacter sp.]HRP55376.1 glycosyltransferase family 4 protein [Agriterribacter sp.]
MEKHLHIICLDVPYPPNYGGVFDLYYKLKYLHERGVIIHLHCYEYGRGKQVALLQYCNTVRYYKRSRGWQSLAGGIPYIVGSRADPALLQNLSEDSYPVLLEGIHSTYLLYKNRLAGRKVILRLHNIEFEYYQQLSHNAASLFHRIYYAVESVLLKHYERKIASKASLIIAVTEKDAGSYASLFGAANIRHLPVFTAWDTVAGKGGKGEYCLYQGNLSVSENEQAAVWLIKNVFSGLKIPFVIAGKNPSHTLKKEVQLHAHISIIENPSQTEMQQLVQGAQVNLLPSFTTTGIKLKFLHALFCGRHCIANTAMAEGTGMKNACTIAENDKAFIAAIETLYHQPFTKEMIADRQELLEKYFNNRRNAMLLMEWIWDRQAVV